MRYIVGRGVRAGWRMGWRFILSAAVKEDTWPTSRGTCSVCRLFFFYCFFFGLAKGP